jgi:uncharacterized membrane protein YedE/YeeE
MLSSPLLAALAGGVLIGLAASVVMLTHGRIAGISGIFGGLLRPKKGETLWRALFIAGLVAGGALLSTLRPEAFQGGVHRSSLTLALAGLLVGFGSRLGSGCTSGHGVCGISRLSWRSIAATMTFMATGAVVVFIVNRVLGGSI